MIADPLIPALQAFFGVEHIVPAARGSLGIYAALRAWGGTGLVAVPAVVCQDVVAAILMANRQPWFCDVDPITGHPAAAEWLRARAAGAQDAIVVHLYGNPANLDAARNAFPNGLVIDDAAQALGAVTPHGLAGTAGDIGIVSFGHTKHIQTGGAALLCRDPNFAYACAMELIAVTPASNTDIQTSEKTFRTGFEMARSKLRMYDDPSGFNGLLDGYTPVLKVPVPTNRAASLAEALADYPARRAIRRMKASIWREVISGTGLVPVGMDSDSAPWRFSCRLPGCDWKAQHHLGEALRSKGLHVSHWYLPAHWFLGGGAGSLPGAEQLAREAFQFWLDEATNLETIAKAGTILQQVMKISE